MKYTTDQILALYRSEAKKHGGAGTSTIQDMRTRKLEMDALFSYLRDGLKVLEVGCGNGFVARTMVDQFDIDLDAIDFSPDLIALAKQRSGPVPAGASASIRATSSPIASRAFTTSSTASAASRISSRGRSSRRVCATSWRRSNPAAPS